MTLQPFQSLQRSPAIFIFALASALIPAFAQQPPPPALQPQSRTIHLDVVVTDKSGTLVPNLAQQDFTLLDNKQPLPIKSFKVVNPSQEHVEVILLLDAVNSDLRMVAYARDGLERYLRSNEGRLAQPTTLAVLTDKGAQITRGFSTDGNQIGEILHSDSIGIREINRDTEWSGPDRFQISLTALHQLVQYASSLPGRKIVLWVSPGWPLLSGPRMYLDSKEIDQLFGDVVSLSTQMRLANMTLYNLNPIGVGQSLMRADYYEAFLNGVSKPDQVQIGDLGLQVLAVHSGGLTIESDSDLQGMIKRCLADTQSWYEIDFDPPPADKPNEYHHVEIKIDKPGLTARTRDSYYSNPTPNLKH